MNTAKRILACGLAITMIAGLTACEDETPVSGGSNVANSSAPNQPGAVTTTTSASTTVDPNDALDLTDKETKEFDTSLYQPSGNAGTVKYMGYYDITSDQKGTEQTLIFQSELFNGKIEYINAGATTESLLEKLSTAISADESPDLVEKSALYYPANISKQTLFQPLDGLIDIDSALWKDMKDVSESYAWEGKHYYYPHRINTSFALNYSKKTVEENDLPDPYTLYRNGEWTWDAWRDMMLTFCDKSEDNIGFYATDTTIDAFILTTGYSIIDVQPTGVITNNIQSPAVSRAMQFIETLCRDGVTYKKQYQDWVDPKKFATVCDKMLFLCMEPEWTYIAATEQVQNLKGVDNDIFDTVSEFAFVPFPRDPNADAYYQAYDTFGYLIPKGAKNTSGSLEFINLNRAYEIDPVISAQVKNDHIAPKKIYFEKGSNTGKQKWVITWGEQEYDLWREMCDPANFTFISEDAYGFNADFKNQLSTVVMDVVENGASWTQTSTEFKPIADGIVAEYSLH